MLSPGLFDQNEIKDASMTREIHYARVTYVRLLVALCKEDRNMNIRSFL